MVFFALTAPRLVEGRFGQEHPPATAHPMIATMGVRRAKGHHPRCAGIGQHDGIASPSGDRWSDAADKVAHSLRRRRCVGCHHDSEHSERRPHVGQLLAIHRTALGVETPKLSELRQTVQGPVDGTAALVPRLHRQVFVVATTPLLTPFKPRRDGDAIPL